MNDIQTCPVCGDEVKKSERYPSYVCYKDTELATDSNGKPVRLGNITPLGGGFKALYLDGSTSTEVEQTNEVYINGVKYTTREAYMGGIVVLPINYEA